MSQHAPVLTQRLFLRPVELGDAPPTAALMTPAISACLENWPPRLTVPEAMARIAESRRQMARKNGVDWGIFLKPDLMLIGWVGLRRSASAVSGLQASYWLGEPYQGQGFGVEAVGAVLDRARELWPFCEIEATTLPENRASMRLLKRLGFEETSRAHQREHRDAAQDGLRHFTLRGNLGNVPVPVADPWSALAAVL